MKDNLVSKILLAIFLASITFVVYIPSLSNGFVGWDDNTYIVKNPYMCSIDLSFLRWAFTSSYFSNWHPLTWVSYATDYSLWELNPAGYHLTNILLHSINTVLVFLLTIRLMTSDREPGMACEPAIPDKGILTAAGFAGALFGLHPLHVESVAWISERKDVLYAFFYLLTLLYYLRYAKGKLKVAAQRTSFFPISNRHYNLALLFFLCSLLSKPMAVSLPLVLLILDWYPLKRLMRGTFGRVMIEKIPFALLGLCSSIITIQAQHHGGSMISFTILPFLPRLLTGVRSLMAYLLKMLLPFDLSPFYPYPKGVMSATLFSSEYFIPFLMVIGVTTTCIFLLKRRKIYAAAWTYYIVTLLPVLGIVQVGGQAMGDRYTYLPSLGLFLLIGIGIQRFVGRWSAEGRSALVRGVLSLLFGLFLVVPLFPLTVQQIRVWQNDETLWSKVIAIYPEVPVAYKNRGVYYRDHGEYEKAVNDFTIGIAMSPGDYTFYTNRALTYIKLGQPEHALKDAGKVVDLDPLSWKTYSLRGKLYSMLGRHNEALEDYSRALRMTAASAELFNSRGNIYAKIGRLEEAINDYTQAIKLSPMPRQEYYYNRSVVYMMMGRQEDAAKDFITSRNLRSRPNQNPGE